MENQMAVGVCRLENYQMEAVQEAVDRQFAQLSLDRLIKPTMRITLKPNLLMKRKPEDATTTHPSIMQAIIRHLKALGVPAGNITIADSPGGLYNHPAVFGIYASTGMQAVADAEGVNLNDDYSTIETACPNPVRAHSFPLIQPVAAADLVISVCKLKTHCMTGLSGGVKNLFGTLPGLTKPDYHWRYPEKADFCNMLVDLCETVRPGITFCDAVESMEGDGPSSGTKKHTGMLLCSESPYLLDLVLCRVMCKEESEILTVKAARDRGICTLKKEEVPLVGDPLRTFDDFKQPRSVTTDFLSKVPGPLRTVCRPIVDRFLTTRPSINHKMCVGCGKCAESCPAHTIRIENHKAYIDRKNCIRCYCCHEMCPIHAITVKQNRLLKL